MWALYFMLHSPHGETTRNWGGGRVQMSIHLGPSLNMELSGQLLKNLKHLKSISFFLVNSDGLALVM